MTFGSRLKSYRKANYMTQEEFANLCSVVGRSSGVAIKASDISNYENGHCLPTSAKAIVICKVIGMRVSTFTNYTGKTIVKPKTSRTSVSRTRHYNVGGKTINITIN